MALDPLGIVLLAAGVLLFVVELVHPGAFLLVPGTVLLAGALMYILLPDFLLNSPFGPLIIIILAMIAAVVTVPIYRRLAPVHRPMVSTPSSLEGRVGLVTTAVVPDSLSGKVQIDSEIWSARSDRAIPVGSKVRVIAGEGVCVVVRPVEPDRA